MRTGEFSTTAKLLYVVQNAAALHSITAHLVNSPPEPRKKSLLWTALSIISFALIVSIQRACQQQESRQQLEQQAALQTSVTVIDRFTRKYWDVKILDRASDHIRFRTADGTIIDHHGAFTVEVTRRMSPSRQIAAAETSNKLPEFVAVTLSTSVFDDGGRNELLLEAGTQVKVLSYEGRDVIFEANGKRYSMPDGVTDFSERFHKLNESR